jgi:DNA-binding LacI/PurR family transcriptional regulator
VKRVTSIIFLFGDRMPSKRVTMNQIASVAGVSRTTVSYVLNNVSGVNIGSETRNRILEVARDLKYLPDTAAQSLASGQAGTVALVLTQRPHLISEAFLSSIVNGLTAAIKDHGFHLLIEPLHPTTTQLAYGNLSAHPPCGWNHPDWSTPW